MSDVILNSKHGAQRPHKPYGLLGAGRRGEGVWRWEIIYLSLHCHIVRIISALRWATMRASHFNVSVGSDGQSHKTVSTTILNRKDSRNGIEPGSFRIPA